MAKALTDRQAANAARQLAYHRERYAQIEKRLAENEAALDHYLLANDREAAALPGGYAIAAGEDGQITVSAPENIDHGFRQLCLI